MSLSSSVVTHTDGKQAPVTYVEQVQGEETITILPNLAFQTGNPYPFGLDPVSVLRVSQYVYYIVEVHCHVESKYQKFSSLSMAGNNKMNYYRTFQSHGPSSAEYPYIYSLCSCTPPIQLMKVHETETFCNNSFHYY